MDFTISRREALALLSGTAVAISAPKAFAAEKLRVGKAVAQVFGYIPLDIGMKYGFFEKQGLEIEEISFVSGSELAQAVTAGAIDITLSGGPDMAFTAKGAPEIAVATITTSPAFMGIAVGSQSSARTSDDLKGKKIAVTSAGSLTYWLVDELNRVKGWTGDDRPFRSRSAVRRRRSSPRSRPGRSRAVSAACRSAINLKNKKLGRLLVDFRTT